MNITLPESYLSNVWSQLSGVEVHRACGVFVYDREGRPYLDFTSGIGVTNTGHSHPEVVSAIKTQAEKYLFAQMNCVVNPLAEQLAGALHEITPESINRFFFSNSGAEATEAAVKLARAATGRKNIVVFQGSFHGRTHLAMAMTTSNTVYRKAYQPLPAGVFVAPFPHAFRYGWDEATTVDFCLKELNLLLASQTAPSETAAIIIEPVQGEGGYIPVPDEFIRALRGVCDEHGILLIIDEVQSGFGRTGKMFCFEHSGVRPDMIIMAKGMGSGLPISAIGTSQAVMDCWTPGSHGGTYGGGSALACAAALSTIAVLKKEGLPENARCRGQQLRKGLDAIKENTPEIGDVRGRGLMTAVEMVNDQGDPDPELTSLIVKRCVAHGLLLLSCGTWKNVIRWIPPLVVSEDQIEEALKIFNTVLKEIKDQRCESYK